MKLHSSPASPFGRKVKVLARETGLFSKLTISVAQTSPVGPDLGLVGDNPLGKIPCLVLDDGTALVRLLRDLRVPRHNALRCPDVPGKRHGAMGRAAATSSRRWYHGCRATRALRDFLRPEPFRWLAWLDGQLDKVARALDALETADAGDFGDRIDIGTITVGCALGYLDFRFPKLAWRTGRPLLAAWFEGFAARPSMLQTVPPP